jgi:hypothetical protein
MYRLNKIITTEKVNQLQRNDILNLFNICCGIMYLLKQLTVLNFLVH